MSCKEGHLPCLRLVAEVAANPTPEQEFYGSSIPMERAHAPTMASLLAKAKAAKQANIQRAVEARQRRLDTHKKRAQGLRAKEAQKFAIESQQSEPTELSGEAQSKTLNRTRAKEAQNYAIEAQQYEPMELWDEAQSKHPQKQEPRNLNNMPLKLNNMSQWSWGEAQSKTPPRTRVKEAQIYAIETQ